MSKAPKVPPPAAPVAPPRPPPDPRPRAQVAYEGDDEFSVMSSNANKRKPTIELAPANPPPEPEKPDPEKSQNTAWHFIRKIFGQ